MIPESPISLRMRTYLQQGQLLTGNAMQQGQLVVDAVKRVTQTIGTLFFTPRSAVPELAPSFTDYTAMLSEIQTDLTGIGTATPDITATALQLANLQLVDETTLSTTAAQASAKVETLLSQKDLLTPTRFVTTGEALLSPLPQGQAFVDTLEDKLNIDDALTTGITWSPGTLTLKQLSALNLSADASVGVQVTKKEPYTVALQNHVNSRRRTHIATTIPQIDLSNQQVLNGALITLMGTPGNTLETNPTTIPLDGTSEPVVTYVGATDSHADPKNILDGNDQSWFEFERYYAQQVQPLIHTGRSWLCGGTIAEDIFTCFAPDPWNLALKDTGTGDTYTFGRVSLNELKYLELTLQIVLPATRTVTSLTINPYFPENAAKHYNIFSITTDTGLLLYPEPGITNTTTEKTPLLSGPREITGPTIYLLATPTKLKSVTIILRNPYPYACTIGHLFAGNKEQVQHSTYFLVKLSSSTTVEDVRIVPPVDTLTANVGDSSHSSIFSGVSLGTVLNNVVGATLSPVKFIISNLLGLHVGAQTNTTVLENFTGSDVLRGFRYQIGIKDLLIQQTNYAQMGTLTTRPFQFKMPVTRVNLDIASQGETITAEVSGDGATWIPIVDSVPLPSPSSSVRVRFTFVQPTGTEDSGMHTPILTQYTLEGTFA